MSEYGLGHPRLADDWPGYVLGWVEKARGKPEGFETRNDRWVVRRSGGRTEVLLVVAFIGGRLEHPPPWLPEHVAEWVDALADEPEGAVIWSGRWVARRVRGQREVLIIMAVTEWEGSRG